MLAGQAAIAVDNAQLFAELERKNLELRLAYDETIEGWARALDLRDKETEGHSRRVTEMTVALCQQLGASPEQLVHVRRGALLHDIGKMGIRDAVLLKPGKLTDEEWVEMRKHPGYAVDLLSPIEFLRPALDIPQYHHEKWDGSGYPLGLSGEAIPLTARAFAVVDVYDALTSDRPYRAGLDQGAGPGAHPGRVPAPTSIRRWSTIFVRCLSRAHCEVLRSSWQGSLGTVQKQAGSGRNSGWPCAVRLWRRNAQRTRSTWPTSAMNSMSPETRGSSASMWPAPSAADHADQICISFGTVLQGVQVMVLHGEGPPQFEVFRHQRFQRAEGGVFWERIDRVSRCSSMTIPAARRPHRSCCRRG